MADDRKNITPAESTRFIIQAAAALSKRPPEDLTLEEAMQILEAPNPNKQINDVAGFVAEQTLKGIEKVFTSMFGEGFSLYDFCDALRNTPEYTKVMQAQGTGAVNGEMLEALGAAIDKIVGGKMTKLLNDDEPTTAQAANVDAISSLFLLSPLNAMIEGSKPEPDPQEIRAGDVPDVDAIRNEIQELGAAFKELGGQFLQAMQRLQEFNNAELMQGVKSSLDFFTGAVPLIAEIMDGPEHIDPYLLEELKKPEYGGKTLAELFKEGTDEDGNRLPDSLLMKALQAARAARDAAGQKEKRRTKTGAGITDRIISQFLALPTHPDYLNAASLNNGGMAHLQLVDPTKAGELIFEDGRLYFDGADGEARLLTEATLKDIRTKEPIENINLPFLVFFYTHLYKKWETGIRKQIEGKDGTFNPIATFYVPDLARARGLSQNTSAESIAAIKKDAESFHHIIGAIKESKNGRESYYPVLNFEGYNAKLNTVSLSSPYLLRVVEKLNKISVQRKKDGTPILRNDGAPLQIAVNSYLVHTDIMKERNKAAVQNVFIIVQGLERCGGHEYSIRAETLISRNPLFEQQLKSSSNKTQLLKRHFKKTWALLRTQTDLQAAYKEIVLPDPENPADIPTMKTLPDMVIRITHKGKNARV